MIEADDLEAIVQLKARYFRLLDTKDWDGFAALFTDDVQVDTSEDGGPIIIGSTPFVDFLREALASATTVHHGHMPEIEVTSPTTARGIWAMEDHLWWSDGVPINHLHGYGHYHETYEKSGDSWRIKTVKLTRLHLQVE